MLLLCAVAAHAITRARGSIPTTLMGGQMTWAIDKNFAEHKDSTPGNNGALVNGSREVTFTLLTAMEMDPACNYTGHHAHCADEQKLGFLCVDEYKIGRAGAGSDGTFTPELLGGGQWCEGSRSKTNAFEVVSTRHINGLNIVFGKLVHTVVASDSAVAMMAYYYRNDGASRKMTLPQCGSNSTYTALPCAINVEDKDNVGNPRYTLPTGPGYVGSQGYWSIKRETTESTNDFWAFSDVPTAEHDVRFETYVRLCTRLGEQNCSSSDPAFQIKNYHSPVPAIPPLVEVAVTSHTQRADWEVHLAVQQRWVYNGSDGVEYFSPHPQLHLTSSDLDGHQMAHMSRAWRADRPLKYESNLDLECFSGIHSGRKWPFLDTERETDHAYKHTNMRADGTCNIFFDMDRSGGSQVKFDFNFGSNRSTGRYFRIDGNHTESVIFGNDLHRCRGEAGSGMLACDPNNQMACVDPSTQHLSACSGNLMFTHHVVNTVDLPWIDVDNVHQGSSGLYTVEEPRFYTTNDQPGSAQVGTLLSAYMCYAGSANQPPRFMRNLDRKPNASDWLRVPGVTPADYLKPEDTEITCTAGTACVFPIFAQDFLLNQDGKSCVTGADAPQGSCAFALEEDESARYQSTDVVRIEMASGWETYDRLDDYTGGESQGAGLITAYCNGGPSADLKILPCVRDSDCPPGWGTCTGYKTREDIPGSVKVRPGHCIDPAASHSSTSNKQCRTDSDCGIGAKCAMPSCESYSNAAAGGEGGVGSLKCFYKEYFKPEDIGHVRTRCFVATDPQGDRFFTNATLLDQNPEHPSMWDGACNQMPLNFRPGWINSGNTRLSLDQLPGCSKRPLVHTLGEYARTCKSMPVCFKIKIEGNAPIWDPERTPLEANSYDDNGRLVPGRTDVPACEGYDIDLTLRAIDPDGDKVRIFVEDKDQDSDVVSLLNQNLLGARVRDLIFNLDFFSSDTMPFRPQHVGNSQGINFNAYAAVRKGNNSGQDTILPLIPKNIGPQSVISGYAASVEYSVEAAQSIHYILNASDKNGILARMASSNILNDTQNCMVGDNNKTVDDNRCREKLLNMDQTICAFAYDNSRVKSGRWVGKTDPNGKALQFCTETGPPYGSPSESSAKMYIAGKADGPWVGKCTPPLTGSLSGPREGLGTADNAWMRDHSNGDMASPMHCWRIQLQAPPVFVTDPMKLSTPFPLDYDLTSFDGVDIARSAQTARVTPKIGVNVGVAMSWTFVAQDPNANDFVEILVLDDPGLPSEMRAGQTICIGRGSETSMFAADDKGFDFPGQMASKKSRCSKAKLTLSWTPPLASAGNTYKVCAVAKDSSRSCHGIAPSTLATSRGWFGEVQCVEFEVYRPAIRFDLGFLPQMIYSLVGCQTQINLTAVDCSLQAQPCHGQYDVKIDLNGSLPDGAHITAPMSRSGIVRREFKWVPRRGMEGKKFTVCFTAVDALETQPRTRAECFHMMVQKCQYCIGGGSTLSLLMKDFGLDTNWLRVWLHNGNNGPRESVARINNPDLIAHSRDLATLDEMLANSRGQPVVWTGLIYRSGVGESLASVAGRFRTTIAGLLSVNPDISSEDDVVANVTAMCVVPCGQKFSEGTQRAA